MYYSVFNAFFFLFFFYIFSRWQVNHLRNFLLYLQVCYGRVLNFTKFYTCLVEVPLWENSNGLTFVIEPQCFTYQKKPWNLWCTKKIALILTDKQYFLLTHFVEIINTITRIFQWSFRSNIGLLLKWKYTFNYCIKDFIASVQHS